MRTLKTIGLILLGLLGLGVWARWRKIRQEHRHPHPQIANPKHRVLILGGGWAGIYTAQTLLKQLKPEDETRVTLVNRENFFLFTPMLPEVAASGLDTRHIVSPIRRILPTANFVEAEICDIDFDRQLVTVQHQGGPRQELAYDQLVLALGSENNFFNLKGVEEHAFPVKSLGDAILVRNHIIDLLEQADITPPGPERRALTTIVVVGGGLNGVEVCGHLNDFLREALTAYPHIPPEEARIVLLEGINRLMGEMSEELGEFTRKKLEARGVEVWLNARVSEATANEVILADGRRIPTRTLVWSAGIRASDFVKRLPVAKDSRDRIVVDACLRVPDYPGVWALGDAAAVPDLERGGLAPPTAQHALRQAYQAGKNIAAAIHGKEPKPFRYGLKIQLATIGEETGVASLMGFKLSGFPAWWLWRSYYLFRLPRLEKRLHVVLDWTTDLFFPRDIVQLRVFRREVNGAQNPVSPAVALEAQPTASEERI